MAHATFLPAHVVARPLPARGDQDLQDYLDGRIHALGWDVYRQAPDDDPLVGKLRRLVERAGFAGHDADAVVLDTFISLTFDPGTFFNFDPTFGTHLEQRWVRLARCKVANALRDAGRRRRRTAPLAPTAAATLPDRATFVAGADEDRERFAAYLGTRRGGRRCLAWFRDRLADPTPLDDSTTARDVRYYWGVFVQTSGDPPEYRPRRPGRT